MREIKFRVWGMTEKMMIYFSSDWAIDSEYSNLSFYLADNESGFFEAYSDEEESKAILMQYIGLKDNNRKEIYEGDIIKGKVNHQGKEIDIKGTIEWLNKIPAFVVRNIYLTETKAWAIGTIKKLKIIGNVYGNPQLLEK